MTKTTMKRLLILLLATLTTLGIAAQGAGASTTPTRDLVPTGATVMYWTYPGTVSPVNGGSGLHFFTKTIRNKAEIEHVRAMINAIGPYYEPPATMCNDLREQPFTISFSLGDLAASFTKVVFQLGGCGTATVTQHGVAEPSVLGGKGMYAKYQAIQKVISPGGIPLT
jgi:hypothetical protein